MLTSDKISLAGDDVAQYVEDLRDYDLYADAVALGVNVYTVTGAPYGLDVDAALDAGWAVSDLRVDAVPITYLVYDLECGFSDVPLALTLGAVSDEAGAQRLVDEHVAIDPCASPLRAGWRWRTTTNSDAPWRETLIVRNGASDAEGGAC